MEGSVVNWPVWVSWKIYEKETKMIKSVLIRVSLKTSYLVSPTHSLSLFMQLFRKPFCTFHNKKERWYFYIEELLSFLLLVYNTGALKNAEYIFINASPRSMLTRIDSIGQV